MPQEKHKIDAAISAADECLNEMPFILTLFGERGKRFTYSDSFYLPTLEELSETAAMHQVIWLKNVLSNRGLGSYALERHLRVLAGKLGEGRLSQLADKMLASRRNLVSDTQFNEITVELEKIIATTTGLPSRGAGGIAASLLVDAKSGAPGCIEAFLKRFKAIIGSNEMKIVKSALESAGPKIGDGLEVTT